MKIRATVHQEVYIDPADAFACIKKALGFQEEHGSFVCVKNGELMRGKDGSYHGSPVYEYEAISNNPKWIELYNNMQCLDDYFKHSKEPQWNRMVEGNEAAMDEDNALAMGV